MFELDLSTSVSSRTCLRDLMCDATEVEVVDSCDDLRSSKYSMTASLLYNLPSRQATMGRLSRSPDKAQNCHRADRSTFLSRTASFFLFLTISCLFGIVPPSQPIELYLKSNLSKNNVAG